MLRLAKYPIFLAFIMLLILIASPQIVRADDDKTKTSTAPQAAADPWAFKDRYHHFAFETGFAKEIKLNAAQNSNVEMVFFRPQYILRLYDPPKSPIYRLDLVSEGTFVLSVRPHVAGVYGMNEILRTNLRPFGRTKRTMLYLDAGAGINRFNLKVPRELTGKFQFSLQVGVGLAYRPSGKPFAYSIEASAYHYSDNGMQRPNQGVNEVRISIGIHLLPKK